MLFTRCDNELEVTKTSKQWDLILKWTIQVHPEKDNATEDKVEVYMFCKISWMRSLNYKNTEKKSNEIPCTMKT